MIFCKDIKKKQLILFAIFNGVYFISYMKKSYPPLFLNYSTDELFYKRPDSFVSFPIVFSVNCVCSNISQHVIISIPNKVYRRFHRINY